MMRGTGVAKLAAVSVAVVAHGALALALVATEGAQIDGARGGAEVRLGSAFADMSSGVVIGSGPIDLLEATAAA